MITEDLKIKIIQYLDGELDLGSENEIEEILNSNEEANDFCNQMKSLNINLEEFTHTSEYQVYSKKADALIDSVVKKHVGSKKVSNNFSFLEFFSPQNVSGYALTAALFLSVGIFYDDFSSKFLGLPSNINKEAYTESSIPLGLGSEEYFKEIFKTRGLNEEASLLKSYIKETLVEMVGANTSSGVLKYGTDNVKILLQEKTIEENNLNCYLGNIFTNDVKSNILFCSSKNDNSLTFFN